MKILLVGGGSGGPVQPLLAVAEEIKKVHPKAQFLLVGTKNGPERMMAQNAKIPFLSIPAGKWRRYLSWRNFGTPFFVSAGFFRAIAILRKFRPHCVFGAGSFVQVPLAWVAWFMKIPIVLHQQDLVPSLANKLCQIPATRITVTFEDSLTDFFSGMGFFYHKKKKEKVVLTGNPFREHLKKSTRSQAEKYFNLKSDFPTLYAVGGGTGASFINQLVEKALPQLAKTVQIIHSTGHGKFLKGACENYHPYEFISEPGLAYAASDIVLCRAGLSTITELSNLEKVSIIVPMPNSHQEVNAYLLAKVKAAIVIGQEHLTPERLVSLIRKLLFEQDIQTEIKRNIGKIMPSNAGKKIAEIIMELTKSVKSGL